MDGQPERILDAFRLTKPQGNETMTVRCEVWTHQNGFETRLILSADGTCMSSIWESADDMLVRTDEWKSGLAEKG
jgi:hypothetical protein